MNTGASSFKRVLPIVASLISGSVLAEKHSLSTINHNYPKLACTDGDKVCLKIRNALPDLIREQKSREACNTAKTISPDIICVPKNEFGVYTAVTAALFSALTAVGFLFKRKKRL